MQDLEALDPGPAAAKLPALRAYSQFAAMRAKVRASLPMFLLHMLPVCHLILLLCCTFAFQRAGF